MTSQQSDKADQPQIIYIAGAGRSGSTILDRALGAADGVASFNEMHVILTPEYLDRQICSCGADRDDCPFWSDVLGALSERHDLEAMTRLSHRFDTSAMMFALLTGWMSRATRNELDLYAGFVRDLYGEIAKRANVDTIIDSSKIPTRALLLKKYAGLPVHAIHLVRDPRAVAASWLRKKKDPGLEGQAMQRYPLNRTLLVWAFRQVASEALRFRMPYTRVRYEDFAKSPRGMVEHVVKETGGLGTRDTGFVSEFEVDLPTIHSLSGNPDRFETGVTPIRIDDKWKASKPPIGFWRLLLWPLTVRYGY